MSSAENLGAILKRPGRLPAVVSPLVIFPEAIAAAGFGYLILGEPVSWVHALGGLAILIGIFVACCSTLQPPSQAKKVFQRDTDKGHPRLQTTPLP